MSTEHHTPELAVPFLNPATLAAEMTQGDPEPYIVADHVDYLARIYAEACFGDPEFTRIAVMSPPRHGKSQLTSFRLAVWFLSLWPHKRVILVSYEFDFAREWGRKVRNALEEHYPQLGIRLAEDSKAAYRWETAQGGGMQCAGIGGPIVGKGGHLMIIDDPVKNAQDAQSPRIQARNWEWYRSTFRTRFEPGAVCIIMHQRWDTNDLMGKLLAAQEAGPDAEGYEPWVVVNLPALAEENDLLGRKPGQALWPERYNEDALTLIRRSVGSYWWHANYQGQPTILGGDILKEHWWSYWVPAGELGAWPDVYLRVLDEAGNRVEFKARVVELPALERQFQSWDMNFKDVTKQVGQGEDPDPVAGHVYGTAGADLFMLDREWGRFDFVETLRAVRKLSKRNPDAYLKLVEPTANGPAVVRTLKHDIGGFVMASPPRGSKVSRVMSSGTTEGERSGRAVSAAAAVEAGNVYLPHPAMKPWVAELRALYARFPKDGRDDTDAFSQAWAKTQQPRWWAVEQAHAEALKGEPARTVEDLHRQKLDRIRQGMLKPKRGGSPYRRKV